MTDHTPGPWKALKGDEFEPERWAIVFDGEPAWLIATIENGAPGDTLETEAATAHLMAAAGELLAALEEAREYVANTAPMDPTSESEELLDKFDALIAKARGAS